MSVHSPLPPLSSVFSDRHMLVTGVTGYVGKVWLSRMLTLLPGIGHLTVLVRPTADHTAIERMQHIAECSPVFRPLREKYGASLGAFLRERMTVLSADISNDNAGLTEGEVTALAGNVDLVIHFAGLTDFNPDPLRALKVNVEGAMRIADLAVALSAPMIHISTCYVAGRFDRVCPESIERGVRPDNIPFDVFNELDALRALLTTPGPSGRAPRRKERLDIGLARAEAMGWSNIYTYTKALAEHALSTRDDLALTLVRPAIVECARSFPFAGWNEGINTAGPVVALMSTWYRHLPSRPHYNFDIVPVDTVVRGCTLAAAAVLTQQAAPVYQLAMSDCNPFTFAQVVDLNGIAVRRYQRKHGSTPVERFFAFTDGVNGSWDGRGAHTLSALKRISRRVRDTLSEMDAAHIPQPIQLLMGSNTETTLKNARKTANNTSKQISRIQGLLDLYKPFIWDTQWVFKTDNIRDLSSQLSLEDQAAHAFDGAEICWRNYWVNVEYPGLATWCFPLLNGETVASDPAPTHPVVLDMGVSSKLDRTG